MKRTSLTILLTVAVAAFAGAPVAALAATPAVQGPHGASAAAAPSAPIAQIAKRCGNGAGVINGTIVLRLRGVRCGEVRALAHLVTRYSIVYHDGFTCKRDRSVQVGGGAMRCTRRGSLVEFGLE